MTPAEGLAIARARIAEEARARTGFLDLGNLSLTEWPDELSPQGTRWQKLGLLKRLSIQEVGSWDTLTGLELLTALQSLQCSGTHVSSLEPLAGLTALHLLRCSYTQVSSLEPLAGLTALHLLQCSDTQVSNLEPLAGLAALQSLQCDNTRVSSLAPLAGLTALQSLWCFNTSVSSLAPLAGLTALQSLWCFNTPVSGLEPLAGLTALHSLDCHNTQVSSLEPLAGLTALQSLHCYNCPIAAIPDWLSHEAHPALEFLTLGNRQAISGVDPKVLSQHYSDNCLPRLRAHFRDLAVGSEELPDIKLIVLGNGRIGKTQICNRLRGQPFEPQADSTHGIVVTTQDFGADTLLRMWDFGGQDIYHGTHALFMRTRALFLLVWTPQAEDNATHEHGGMTFRNRPLAWWLSYVRHLAGTDSPVLIVQNQCDEPGDERRTSPLPDEALAAFSHAKELHYSARTERGREGLDAALREAIRCLRQQQGTVQIGRGRLAVKERLDAMRNADALVPAAERRHRTLTMEAYRGLCADCGDISDPDALLHYLHHSGVVFYQRSVFSGQIVLDQAWALQAVYAVFNRRQCYQQLRYLRGRFTRSTLGQLLWNQPQPEAPQGYSPEEQAHFLSLMESCGIVFVLRRGDAEQGIETEYLAPDLLPQRDELSSDEQLQLHERWNDQAECDELSVSYPFHHDGVMRALMSKIGQSAGMTAIYWKGGLCLYEQKTRSSAMIEEKLVRTDERGRIILRAQGARPDELLEMLRPLAEQAIYYAGFRDWDTRTDDQATMRRNSRSVPSVSAPTPEAADMQAPASDPTFAHPPRTAKSYAVSYGWPPADADEATKQRYFQPVDALCHDAEAKGIHVLRDVDDLGLNQAISNFMSRLAQQDRVFVILSDKYLRSENCMFEMKEVWRFCQENPDSFRQRVRVYRLPDAKVHDLDYQLELADWWLEKFNTTKGRIGRLGEAGALAPEQLARFNNIDSFAKLVGKILHYVHDTLQPKDFTEFLKHGFED